MSALGKHLRTRVYTLEARLRRGLRERRERTWDLRDQGDWSDRQRYHHGIRRTVERLRRARLHLAEYRALRGRS